MAPLASSGRSLTWHSADFIEGGDGNEADHLGGDVQFFRQDGRLEAELLQDAGEEEEQLHACQVLPQANAFP